MEVKPVYINPDSVAAIVVDRYRYMVILSNGIAVIGSEPKLVSRDGREWYYMEGVLHNLREKLYT